MSEFMNRLKVPTTRSLGVVKMNEKVKRDFVYNNEVTKEFGAITCRLASNFLRIGNFELLAVWKRKDLLEKLFDFIFQNYHPEFKSFEKPECYLEWFRLVVRKNAHLVACWQSVGFVHGVLNTDNTSIEGLTIDYGPFGFMERFDKNYLANRIGDANGRYSYQNQPEIIFWNLVQLANAIYPLVDSAEPLKKILNSYREEFS